MRILVVLAVAVVCFGAGIVAAPFAQWLIRSSSGTQTPQCLESTFCVGDDAADAFATFRLSGITGGVQTVQCGRPSFNLDSLPALAQSGWTCGEPNYLVILGNSEFQTNVQVEGGKIAKITRYSRPNIDP